MDPALLRSLERILAVAIGGMSIVLGYRLFLALPEQRDSSGSVKLPWNITIALGRVGPGTFFALFGAAVVAFGLYSAVTVTSEQIVMPGRLQSETVSMSGFGLGAATGGETPAVRRLRLEEQIRFLNALSLRDDLPAAEKQSSMEQANAIKLALMVAAWDSDWGDATAFKAWVGAGAMEPTPAALRKPVQFFRAGLGGTP
jgi:hypothetical protein